MNQIINYLFYIKQFLDNTKIPPTRLKSDDFQSYLDQYGFKSVSQQNQVINSIRFLYKFGLEKKYDKVSFKRPKSEKKLPVVIDGEYIKGYYDDAAKNNYKYHKEDKEGRLKVERMKMTIRTDYYRIERKDFNVIPDTDDFKYLVDTILSSKKSIHIDGRAGCGKTTLIKMIQKEMDDKEISYKALAPTNKAQAPRLQRKRP
jgi:ABC-type glutathione transport system ATPase component